MPYLLVEYDHNPPVSNEQLGAMGEALGPCLQVRRTKCLRSWISADRDAYHTANVRFRRVWPAMLFEGEVPPDVSPGAS